MKVIPCGSELAPTLDVRCMGDFDDTTHRRTTDVRRPRANPPGQRSLAGTNYRATGRVPPNRPRAVTTRPLALPEPAADPNLRLSADDLVTRSGPGRWSAAL